ncbi:ADP-ribosylation factor-like protein 9 [Takifugu rubripes]|uniref:ADP-ribosylation factor-like protein 9 n=1 Tax=Takifugu rubripes TaxID=31033 RepID=UPI001145B3E2|nr:ADP-ribosylation factor-like protein 9 [Takifugu rubripes]
MFGLKGAGLAGATVALAGGVAYLVWVYATSSRGRRAVKQPGGGGERPTRKGERKEEEEPLVAAAAAPVAASAPETSESRPLNSSATQVLVLGLDGAGKTSLLRYWSTGGLEQDVHPSEGFNAVSINRDDVHVEFLEIGGREDLRPYWRMYMPRALMLVFVVDASRPQLFPVAKQHLHELLASDPRLPLMVLANKQDLPGASGVTDLHDALGLSEVGERRLFLIGTHAKKGQAEPGSGTRDAWDLIIQLVGDAR